MVDFLLVLLGFIYFRLKLYFCFVVFRGNYCQVELFFLQFGVKFYVVELEYGNYVICINLRKFF